MIKVIIFLLMVAEAGAQALDFKSCMLYRNQARAPRDSNCYWSFDSDSGADRSPSNNPAIFDRNLAVTLTPTFSDAPAGKTKNRCYMTAKASKEMCYTTKSTSVGTTNSTSAGAAVTLSFWCRRIVAAETTSANFYFEANNNTGGSYLSYGGLWDSNYSIVLYMQGNVGNLVSYPYPANDTNNWYYFTLVKNNHYFALYTNGVFVTARSNNLFDAGTHPNGQRLFMGAQGSLAGSRASNAGSYYFDDVSMIYRALTAPEITNQYLRAARR